MRLILFFVSFGERQLTLVVFRFVFDMFWTLCQTPTTISKYEEQLQARIQLLLDVRPSWLARSLKFPEEEKKERDDDDGTVVEGGRQLSQASSVWQDTLPQETLKTLVAKWNSRDSREERERLKIKWNDVQRKNVTNEESGGEGVGEDDGKVGRCGRDEREEREKREGEER